MGSVTMKSALFQPNVQVDEEGTILTDWMGSYDSTFDGAGVEFVDAEPLAVLLDQRLAAIRQELASNTSILADLVRPFFEARS
jgi:hypothetical protein